jgi:SAM-dependent methyltransferase
MNGVELPQQFGNQQANLHFLEQTGLLRRGLSLLEIGSGTGALLQVLRARRVDVRGVELNPRLIEEGRKHFGDLPIVNVSGIELPFDAASFDVVMSFDVLEHIPDVDGHLREVSRVLRPGGSYLIQTPNKWTNVVFETIRWRSFTRFREDHCSLHSLNELRRRLARHGFDVRVYDVPVVNDFFKRKVRQYVGAAGLLALRLVNPDRLPRALRTNLYVEAVKPS